MADLTIIDSQPLTGGLSLVKSQPLKSRNEGMGKPKVDPGYHPEEEGAIMDALHMPIRGVQQVAQGVGELSKSGQRAHGVSDIIRGAPKILAPYAPQAIVAAPLMAAGGAVGSGVGSAVGESAARGLGADDDTAQAAGDVLSIPGAALGGMSMAGRGAAAVKGAAGAAVEQVRPLLSKFSAFHPTKILPDVLDAGRATIEGGKKGIADYNAAGRVGQVRDPLWKDVPDPSGPPQPPTVEAPNGLPSGRIPGGPQNIVPRPSGGAGRVPAWKDVPDPSPSPQPPMVDSPAELPSGRVPGGMAAQTPIPGPPNAGVGRVPAWKDVPDPQAPSQPPTVEAPAELPSGRVPGGFAAQTPPPESPNAGAGRSPIWQGLPESSSPPVPPTVESPGALPSGRVPGGMQNMTSEVPVETISPEDVAAGQGLNYKKLSAADRAKIDMLAAKANSKAPSGSSTPGPQPPRDMQHYGISDKPPEPPTVEAPPSGETMPTPRGVTKDKAEAFNEKLTKYAADAEKKDTEQVAYMVKNGITKEKARNADDADWHKWAKAVRPKGKGMNLSRKQGIIDLLPE